MANPGYVRSTDGVNTDDGSTWALANDTLANGFADAAAGDRVWISDVHDESTDGAITLTSPGTAASPCEVLCGDDVAEPPTALATTGKVKTSTASGRSINFAGFAYCYGVQFICGATGSANQGLLFTATTPWGWTFDNCLLHLNHSNSGLNSSIIVGGATTGVDDQQLRLISTTVKFGVTSQEIVLSAARFHWSGGSVDASGAAPAVLFLPTAGLVAPTAVIENVDLSHLAGSSALVNVGIACPQHVEFRNCKLHASVAIVSGSSPGPGGPTVRLHNCTGYTYYFYSYEGEIFHESTIVLSGGSTMPGSVAFSHRMVASANARFTFPLIGDPVAVFNTSTGSSVTATVEIISFGASKLTDREVWGRVDAMTTSSQVIGTTIRDRAADILASAADQTTSSQTWTGTARANSTAYSLNNIISVQGRLWICTTAGTSSGSEPAGYASGVDGDSVNDGTAVFRAGWRQKLDVTFTPQTAGLLYFFVVLAKASTTIYVNREVSIS